jgi:hypothetical protein
MLPTTSKEVISIINWVTRMGHARTGKRHSNWGIQKLSSRSISIAIKNNSNLGFIFPSIGIKSPDFIETVGVMDIY